MPKCELLKLHAFSEALTLQSTTNRFDKMSFNERLADLLDAQILYKSERRTNALRKQAKLRYPNSYIQDIDYSLYPTIKINQLKQLLTCDWIRQHHHLLIIGKTGTGKTTMSCVIAQEAIKQHIPVLFFRLATLLLELCAAQKEERLRLFIRKINRAPLLLLDDWGNALMGKDERHLFFELIESRDLNSSLLITSQYPVSTWHESFQDSTIADSVLDRIVHNAHKIELKGESIRKLLRITDEGEG